MGNAKSCETIKPRINRVCDIGKCTKSIRGYASNSASPTDIWELTLYPNMNYGEEKIPRNLIMKLYVSDITDKFYNVLKKYDVNISTFHQGKEVQYESDIYNYAIGLITRENINPYFVRYYGAAEHCDKNELASSVYHKFNTKMSEDKFIKLLNRNTVHMLANEPGRPSIEDDRVVKFAKQDQKIKELIDNEEGVVKYGMILTEKSEGVQFYKFVRDASEEEILIGLVQVLSGLTAVEVLGVAHNDLHHGNIFVEKSSKSKLEQFKISKDGEELTFGIRSNFRCAIYDWDRGYMKELGNNPIMEQDEKLCQHNESCNKYIAEKQVYHFLSPFYRLKNSKKFNNIIDCVLFRDKKGKEDFIDAKERIKKLKDFKRFKICRASEALIRLLVLLTEEGKVSPRADSLSPKVSFLSKFSDKGQVVSDENFYDMTEKTIKKKFNNYFKHKDFKSIEIFENDN